MNASPNNVLNGTKCLSLSELKLYHEDKLPAADKHRAEDHLLDCELCSEALAGFAIIPVTPADISDIHQRIDTLAGASQPGLLSSKLFMALTIVTAVCGTGFLAYKIFSGPELPLAGKLPGKETASQYIFDEPPKNTIVFNSEDTGMQHIINPGKPSGTVPDANEVYPNEAFMTDIEIIPVGNISEIIIDKKKASDEELKRKTRAGRDTFIYDLKITDFDRYYYVNLDALKSTSKSTEAVFENEEEKENPGVFKVDEWRVITTAHVLKKGLKKFNAQDYENALKLFTVLINYDETDVNALFYGAVCCVNLSKPDKAIQYLDKVLQNENNTFHEEAKWYTALAYVKKKDLATAKKLLNEIVAENGFYAGQAKDKLKEI
ncbi:MAG: hypothetical protein AB1458_03930 [Bacteroidota bacterium]